MISVGTLFFGLWLVIYISGHSLKSAASRVFGDNPYQVLIQTSSGSHICSRVIIAARHILTSAHCISDENRKIRLEVHHVVIGNVTSSEVDKNNVFDILQIKIHKASISYDFYENDFAILKVDRDMTLEGHGMIISLPLNDRAEGSLREASGWEVGEWNQQFEGTGTTSLYLRKTRETVLNQTNCQLYMYPERIQPKHVCAESEEKRELCHSDGGASLVVGDHFVGIISYNLCDRGYIGVYTRVYKFLPWIREVIDA